MDVESYILETAKDARIIQLQQADPQWVRHPLCTMNNALAVAHGYWEEALWSTGIFDHYAQALDILGDKRIQPLCAFDSDGKLIGIVLGGSQEEDDYVFMEFDSERNRIVSLTFGGVVRGKMRASLSVKFEGQQVSSISSTLLPGHAITRDGISEHEITMYPN